MLAGFGFADERPANPVARISKETANDSPSPWGEGRDEGEFEQTKLQPIDANRTKLLEQLDEALFNMTWLDCNLFVVPAVDRRMKV